MPIPRGDFNGNPATGKSCSVQPFSRLIVILDPPHTGNIMLPVFDLARPRVMRLQVPSRNLIFDIPLRVPACDAPTIVDTTKAKTIIAQIVKELVRERQTPTLRFPASFHRTGIES